MPASFSFFGSCVFIRPISTSLASFIDVSLDKYLLDIQHIVPPIPYLKIIYPDLYHKHNISQVYDMANFSLDLSDLKERYILLQKKVHPDSLFKDLENSGSVRLKSLGNVSHLVGEGYFNLRDPIKRAEHWLCMHQTYFKKTGCLCCSLACDKKVLLPSDFLEELVVMHEALDENKEEMKSIVDLRKKKIIDSLPPLVNDRQWNTLSSELAKYRYLDSITARM